MSTPSVSTDPMASSVKKSLQPQLLDRLRLRSSWNDLKTPKFYRGILAEFIGMFYLIFIDTAAGTRDPINDRHDANEVRISICAGMCLGTLIWIYQDASGAFINPCVSLAFFFTRRISLVCCLVHIGAHLLGGCLGAYMVTVLTIDDANPNIGMTLPHKDFLLVEAIAIEGIGTAVMLFTTFSSIDKGRFDMEGSRPLMIGFTVTLSILAFIPLTGSALNPVRAFAPALVKGNWRGHWVYWVGPNVSAIITGLFYDLLLATTSGAQRIRDYLTSWDYDPDAYFYGVKTLTSEDLQHNRGHMITTSF